MFTIDLLKGQGIPAKSGPESIAITSVAVVVPAIVAIVMFSIYLRNGIIILIEKQEIVRQAAETNKLSEALGQQRSLEQEINVFSSCLSEVSSSINRHTQWSPVLVTLVENMPASVVLTKLDVRQRFTKRKIPGKDDPKKMVNVTIPVRTLHMSVYGSLQSNCDKAVREFRDRLRSSALLGPRIENIRISQKYGKVEGQNVVSYEIDCIFKPGM